MELDRKIGVHERKRMHGHCKILRFILPKDFFNTPMSTVFCSLNFRCNKLILLRHTLYYFDNCMQAKFHSW